MFFHVLTTTECDLKCTYCYGKSCDDIESDFGFDIDYSLPSTISYDVDALAAFCQHDPECVLSFYGGEPTLRLETLQAIMDAVKAKHFLVHTNGLHLTELQPEYTNRLHTIFVSIDGDQTLTDHYRGKGVYHRVIENLRAVVQSGFHGEIVARMTVLEDTNIAKAVTWLLQNDEFNFSSIHWQLDAGFWKSDFPKRAFKSWVKESYNPGIQRLVKLWVDQMQNEGQVFRLYPFIGLMESLLRGEDSLLRCGSGWINYSILTDGTIVPCPVMGGMRDFYLGTIYTTTPRELKKVFVSEPCTSCNTLGECGGRCLYANITKRWGSQAYGIVCDTIRNLTSQLKNELPRIQRLITEGTIQLDDFSFLKHSGCEIIP